MKPKISRQEFFKLKEEIIKLIKEFEEVIKYSKDENSEEEFFQKYKNILEKLTSHNLSEILSEDWNEIIIASLRESPEIRVDFSDTYANLDFSIVQFSGDNFNFESCLIDNIEQGIDNLDNPYEMFDKKTIEANQQSFVNPDLPEEVKNRFYMHRLTFRDIVTYEEIFNKAKGHISPVLKKDNLEDLLDKISFMEIQKIDIKQIDMLEGGINTVLEELLKQEKLTADIFNQIVLEKIRDNIITYGPRSDYEYSEEFRKANSDLIFREENPELFDLFGQLDINLRNMYDYSEILRGKKFILQQDIKGLGTKIGFDMIEIIDQVLTYEQTKFLIDNFISNNPLKEKLISKIDFEKLLELPIEERGEILKVLADSKLGQNILILEDALKLEKVIDKEDINYEQYNDEIKKYGAQNFISIGVNNVEEMDIIYEESLEKLKQYSQYVDIECFINAQKDVGNDNLSEIIHEYGIDFYINRGYKSMSSVIRARRNGINLEQIKELVDSGIKIETFIDNPYLVEFINTFGIDNIIKLNEESEEMFSSAKNNNNRSLAQIALYYNRLEEKYEANDKITYEEFIEEIVKVVRLAKEKRANIDKIGEISQKVKEKIPEEFLSRDEINEASNRSRSSHSYETIAFIGSFNAGKLRAEDIKTYSNIMSLLKNKNLANAVKINARLKDVEDQSKVTINFAEYFSKKFGNEELLKICEGYGALLDKVQIEITGHETLEQIWKIIDNSVYNFIKTESEVPYFGDLDDNFKKNHPEIFLDYDVEEQIKQKFYTRDLKIRDLQDPKVKKALIGKDIALGAQKTLRNSVTQELYENLSREEFFELIDEYGIYLHFCDKGIIKKCGKSVQELKRNIEKEIKEKIKNRDPFIFIDDNPPQFLKDECPQYFIDELTKEDRDKYYSFRGTLKFEKFYDTFQGNKLNAFKGKDISINFVKNYGAFFKAFSENEILGIFSKYGRQLDRIVDRNIIEIFKKNYEEYGQLVLDSTELIIAATNNGKELEKSNFMQYLDLVKKSNFNLNREYERTNAERLVAKIYLFLGYDNAVELFKLPEMSKEELVRAIEEKEKEFDQACEVRFSLKDDIQIVTEMFRKLDLSEYENGNKKMQFEILKKLNSNLENGFDGSFEQLLEDSISKTGNQPNKQVISDLGNHLNFILTAQKMEKLNPYIMNSINNNLTATGPNRKIILDIFIGQVRKSLLENSDINKEQLLENLEKEILLKTKQDGTPFYSPQVRNHFEDIKKIVSELLDNKEIEQITSKTVIDCVKSERDKIGNGWIRKVLNIPSELSLEQIELLEQKLYGTDENHIGIQYDKKVVVKSKIEKAEENAYTLLNDLNNPLIITISKAELIFDKIEKPYSEKFVEFFMANRKEILENPNFYSKMSQLHKIFDETIERVEVKNRYDKGLITVSQMFDFITNNDRPYGLEQDGDWELSRLSRGVSLDSREFQIAQKMLEKMKKREFQTIPPIKNKTSGKYRGRILRSDDPLHIVVGDITTCCQHIGGYGETSMIHSAIEKNGSLFIVEELDEFGNVVNTVAQSWTWRNNDTVCFDNVEIPDILKPILSTQDYEEITKVYQDTAKSIIKTDAKFMKKMLDESKITQKQYDELVVKEVIVGLGCNDLKPLDNKKRFFAPKQKVLPFERGTQYLEYRDPEGNGQKTLYTDVKDESVVLANIADVKDEIEQIPLLSKNLSYKKDEIKEIPIGYGKLREVLSHKGKEINLDDIKVIQNTNKFSGRHYIFEECESRIDIADKLDVDEKDLRLLISRDEDWYVLSAETDNSINIYDYLKILNEEKLYKKSNLEQKIAGLEMASNMYELFIEADKKNKSIIMQTQNDNLGIDFEVLVQNGIIKIDEQGRAKNITVIDRQRLQEETDKIKEILEKQEELLIIQGVNKKQEEKEDKEITIDY